MTATNTYGRQVVLPITNKSGGSVAAGDVVIVDTSNNDAFTTTTTGATTEIIGIAQETIASNATGRVLLSGYAALINVNASVTRGHYGATHTVVKQAADAGASRGAGTFCQFLTGGTTPDAMVWPTDLGGGTGAPTTSKYITSAADGGLSAEIVIPGLAASPDIRVAGTNDDEFDTTAAGVPTGWTSLNSPSTVNGNTDALSHLHLVANAAAGDNVRGIYKACPSIPFTMTAKLTDSLARNQYTGAGILIAEASPGKLITIGPAHNGTGQLIAGTQWTNVTTAAAAIGTSLPATPSAATQLPRPLYLRILVTSSTNITLSASLNGLVWVPLWAAGAPSPAFTVGAVGLYVNSNNATDAGNGYFDWVRFT